MLSTTAGNKVLITLQTMTVVSFGVVQFLLSIYARD